MEQIRYMDRITTEKVSRRVQENRTHISNVLKRKPNCIDHIIRRNELLHDSLEGKMEGGNTSRLSKKRIQILDRKRYWKLKKRSNIEKYGGLVLKSIPEPEPAFKLNTLKYLYLKINAIL